MNSEAVSTWNDSSSTEPNTNQNELEHAVAEMCVRVPVSAGAAGLARELARILPQRSFRDVLTRCGWYRLGGVISVWHAAEQL